MTGGFIEVPQVLSNMNGVNGLAAVQIPRCSFLIQIVFLEGQANRPSTKCRTFGPVFFSPLADPSRERQIRLQSAPALVPFRTFA